MNVSGVATKADGCFSGPAGDDLFDTPDVGGKIVLVSVGLEVVGPAYVAAEPATADVQRERVEPKPLVSEPRDVEAEFGEAVEDPGLSQAELSANAEFGGDSIWHCGASGDLDGRS